MLKYKEYIFSIAMLLYFRIICKSFRRRRGKSGYLLA